VGLVFPQILFFGYETLNTLLKNNSLPLTLIGSLLGVKTLMTAICAGSGLVGGTFAPSLFLGAMLGAGFHEVASQTLQTFYGFDLVSSGGHNMDAYTFGFSSVVMTNAQNTVPQLQLASTPAYAMVGAASVLAALFRAPLTASLLLFEITRNYDIIVPLMASAGIGSIVSDILEDTFERHDEMRRRDFDPVSWGDLADDEKKDPSSIMAGRSGTNVNNK
jgi:H+/Cl- antiporter ClcA